MTLWTIPCVLAVAVVVLRPRTYPFLQALAGVTPNGAALILGGTAVPTFYFVAMAAPVVLLLERLRPDGAGRHLPPDRTPGARPLTALLVWGLLVSAIAPVLFPGVEVWASAFDSRTLDAGAVGQSTVAQSVYLALSVCVVLVYARLAPGDLRPLWIIAGGVIALSLWRWTGQTLDAPFPAGVFDNNTTVRFIEGLPGGGTRFRGTLAEPSALALVALGAGALFAFSAVGRRGYGRLALVVGAAVSLWMGFASGAATFVLSLSILVGALLVLALVRWIAGRRASTGALASLHVVAVAAVFASGTLMTAIGSVVESKVASDSFTERSGLDGLAVQILVQTDGLGAGLGTHRPSSLAATLVSTVGIPGLLLFAATFVAVFWSVRHSPAALPGVMMIVALLTAKLVSGPDLNDTSGLLWVGLGILAGAGRVIRADQNRPTPPSTMPALPAEDEVAL